ncbi:MAG: alcohol dehydrogenase catalytic domain-containing protein [Treponema sp.]|nr:alcohol dehydrogenase catalytic domain-containing protein [Treponema sp.]
MQGTMRAQVVTAPNVMELKQVPIPQINDDEVLIKIKYCGICGSDWSIFTGKYVPERLPLVTGHEFFGTVAEVGSKAPASIKVGQRVSADIVINCGACYFCRRGDGLLCQSFEQIGIHTKETSGGFSEYLKAPWRNIYQVPDEIDDYTAVFVEPMTTVIQASRRMNAKIGSSVVVIGSGLGILHGTMAKLRGCAPVIIVDNNKARLAKAKEMCADYIIDIDETPDAVAEVKKLTGGIGADYVIEAVGNPRTYEQAFQMIRRGGHVEAFGIAAPNDPMSLPPFEFVLGEKKVAGSCAGIGNDWGDAITLLRYGRVKPLPLLSMAVPLEDLETALKEIQSNKKLVKVIVSPEISQRVNF